MTAGGFALIAAALFAWLLAGGMFGEFDIWLALLVGAALAPTDAALGAAVIISGLGRRAALFMGWFGPRGLASVVFALLAVEELGPHADTAVAVIVTTVLLSVLAHGVTAAPLATRYGASLIPSTPVTSASTPRDATGRPLSVSADRGFGLIRVG